MSDLPLAFSTLACPGWSLERAVEAARAHGYAGIELRLLDGQVIEADIGPAARRRVRTVLESAGLPAVALDTSVRLAGGPGAARELRSLLEVAAEWRSPLVRVFGGGDPPGALDAMARVLEAAVPDAERLGVAIAVETHDALSSARVVADLLARVPSSASGALWDVLHTWRMGEEPDLVTHLLGDRLLHVHVKDGRPRDGADWDLVPLGEGTVPMARTLRALRDAGYRGWLSVEWEKRWHPELAEPEVALPQHSAALAALE